MRNLDESCEPCNGVDIPINMDPKTWKDEMDKISIQRAEMNNLVMNYLVMEGFKEAAEKFAAESGLAAPANTPQLDTRIHITKALREGKIEQAMRMVTEIHPEILDDNHLLFFHLQQLVLIELIRENKVEEAVTYAQEHLAEKGLRDKDVLNQIERTLALLAYDAPESSPFGDLLLPSQRHKVASELNVALLEIEEQQSSAAKMSNVLKLLLWTQDTLHKENIKIPTIVDLNNVTLTYHKK